MFQAGVSCILTLYRYAYQYVFRVHYEAAHHCHHDPTVISEIRRRNISAPVNRAMQNEARRLRSNAGRLKIRKGWLRLPGLY